MAYNRYDSFKENGITKTIPFIKLKGKSTDKTFTYELGKTRLNDLSNFYYNSPEYKWLILLANPEYSLEFEIPDKTELNIPFPLQESINQYKEEIRKYKILSQ